MDAVDGWVGKSKKVQADEGKKKGKKARKGKAPIGSLTLLPRIFNR